ncbi:MAG TPA: hypothetical protein P5137_08670 [Candidatus Brocadiia bacterium]|nr:hypothetical protein [Candidatus Brocadiia bacterium]
MFLWQDVDGLGDLERLRLTLSVLPDKALMRPLLGRVKKNSRDRLRSLTQAA